LIQKEDAGNLQKVTDLSTDIHGEVNSLYDLVFSFVECGRIRQARKILETPGLRTRPQRINSACERYRQEGMTQSLEGLMEATKDLNHIDRGEIYYSLLLTYIKEVEPEKALGLWTKMQEEDITPSDVFLTKLADFLQKQNVAVPFVVPEPQKPAEEKSSGKAKVTQAPAPTTTASVPKVAAKQTSAQATEKVKKLPVASETAIAFKQALKSGDIDQILTAKQKLLPSDKISITDQSLVVEALVKNDRLNEATKMVLQMINEQQTHPIPRIFRFYLNKLAASGDVATMKEIGSKLNSEIKKLLSFDNRFCHANIVAGKSSDYLKQLEMDIDSAKTEEEIKEVGEKFPRGGAVGILDTLPESSVQFEEVAVKYAKKGLLGPMNVLWMHHFINNNTSDSDRLWNQYLAAAPRLMFQRVVHLAREKQDGDLVQRLINLLKTAKVSEGALGNAYSCLLDIQSAKNDYTSAMKTLDEAIKDVCLENINRTALVRVKDGIEAMGQKFPHNIPAKSGTNKNIDTSSSSSSSSSDEEVTQKKE
jgi:leucine-rich PPR motif-containing protein